jgi:molecular chaperone DnaK
MEGTKETAGLGRAIGIDLGTTNSVMMQKGKGVEIIYSKPRSEDHVPSVVCYYKGEVVVGRTCVDVMAAIPEDSIYSIKRLMGRGFRDEEVQRIISEKKVEYRIVNPSDSTEDDVRVIMGGREYSPVDISAMILRKMKKDAEEYLNAKVTHAVITVPAYFKDKHRHATALAGYKAGFIVKDILDEPTAAAVAYGVDNVSPGEVQTVLVYDLGGGTFDVSILMIAGGAFAQLAVDGDLWLGGDDFDRKIRDYVIEAIEKQHRIPIDRDKEKKFMIVLKHACEKAKIELSSMQRADVVIAPAPLVDQKNNIINVDVEITRSRFESMIAADIAHSLEIVQRAITAAKITRDQINHVLLVGGSTNIPYVEHELERFFGKDKILRKVNPMLCVAQGAAILAPKGHILCPQCMILNQLTDTRCSRCGCTFADLVKDEIEVPRVTAEPLGIEMDDGKFSSIIDKGTPYPTDPVTRRYHPSRDNLRRIRIPIYCGREDIATKNDLVGIVWFHPPRGMLKRAIVEIREGGGTRVDIEIDRGDNWTNRVERKLKELEETVHRKEGEGIANRDTADRFNEEIDQITRDAMEGGQKDAILDKIERLKVEIENIRPASDTDKLVNNAEFLCNWTERALHEYDWMLKPEDHLRLSRMLEALRNSLSRKDSPAIKRDLEELDRETNKYGLIVVLMNAILAEIHAEQGLRDPAAANSVRAIRHDVEAAAKRGDGSEVKRLADMLNMEARKILGKETDQKGPVMDVGGLNPFIKTS